MNPNHDIAHEPKYYFNQFNSKNAGKRIMSIDKLYEGQNYLITYDKVGLDESRGADICGPLVEKSFSGTPSSTKMAYYGIEFRIGTAKYDGINMKDQINQFHWQQQCTLADMRLKVYEYRLDLNLQAQIKWFNYYKKTAKNVCVELGVCEDVERIMLKFLV